MEAMGREEGGDRGKERIRRICVRWAVENDLERQGAGGGAKRTYSLPVGLGCTFRFKTPILFALLCGSFNTAHLIIELVW